MRDSVRSARLGRHAFCSRDDQGPPARWSSRSFVPPAISAHPPLSQGCPSVTDGYIELEGTGAVAMRWPLTCTSQTLALCGPVPVANTTASYARHPRPSRPRRPSRAVGVPCTPSTWRWFRRDLRTPRHAQRVDGLGRVYGSPRDPTPYPHPDQLGVELAMQLEASPRQRVPLLADSDARPVPARQRDPTPDG